MGRYNVTQIQLAQVLRVAQSAVSNRLHGKTPFDVNELGILAEFFHVTIGELLGERTGPRQGPPDGGASLPRLDSNQQPFGYSFHGAAA